MSFRVDTAIPFGNACDVQIVSNPGLTEVAFAPDPHGGPECLWFCFRIARTSGGVGKIRVILKNTQNMLGGSTPENIRPVIRNGGGDWERLGKGQIINLPDGRRNAAWVIDAPEAHVDIACCYPYGMTDVDSLVRDGNGFWKADTIGTSQGGRPLVRLSNNYGREGSDLAGLYLLARQHSGETPGAWVLDGFLRHIASLGDKAPLVWAVPLANIDGVEQGDYGKDNFPYDLNRAWGRPAMRHEVQVMQQDIVRWKRRCRAVLGMDFHAPGACEAAGAYAYMPDPQKHPQMHERLVPLAAAVKAALTPRYAAEDFARVARYASRWETPRFSDYLRDGQNVLSFTMEIPYAMVNQLVLTREDYRQIGQRVAQAVLTHIGG